VPRAVVCGRVAPANRRALHDGRHGDADLARSVGPDLVVPIHYDVFEPIETDVEAFAAALATDGIRVEVL